MPNLQLPHDMIPTRHITPTLMNQVQLPQAPIQTLMTPIPQMTPTLRHSLHRAILRLRIPHLLGNLRSVNLSNKEGFNYKKDSDQNFCLKNQRNICE